MEENNNNTYGRFDIFLHWGAFGKLYSAGTVLHFRIVATSEDVEFARKYLGRYFEGEEPAAWDRAIRDGEIKIARADLDEDGVPEVFIMVENSIWCGSRGCDGLLLQNRRGQWALMASPKISEEVTIIMPEKSSDTINSTLVMIFTPSAMARHTRFSH